MTRAYDPIQLEVFKHLFHSVAEEMGGALRRSAFSPNIKERRDYSCAVFSAEGEVLAMGDHMPVHLGSMPHAVEAAVAAFPLAPGDAVLLNDPFAGGTHLPDLTLVMPVYVARPSRAARPSFYIANRAHHADVGGAQAGSMGLAREIYQEGLRIPPVKLLEGGRIRRDVLALLLANVRTPREREGDLTAQIAACRLGERRLQEAIEKYGLEKTARYGRFLLEYSERMMRAALREIRNGTYRAEDFLDDDGITEKPVRIAVTIGIAGNRATVDFSGSAPECAGGINAVRAIAESAVFYCFRCLLNEEVPATAGLMRPIRILAPERSVVNARPPRAVAGGNVETSQRIVDTILRALAEAIPERIPAASQGTMNNVSFGGADTRRGRLGEPFAYYETIAGGMGGRCGKAGISGIHTHMTNSLNTPVEVLEHSYPVRVVHYGLRQNSAGQAQFSGGNGITRAIEFLTDVQLGLLCDRRKIPPYGLRGGQHGKAGKNWLIWRGKRTLLAGKCSLRVPAGYVLVVESPGGGGWGKRKPGDKRRS